MLELARASGMPVVSPYDAAVIAGQGTVGYEFVRDVPDLDVMLVPVGAGGLLAGCLACRQADESGIAGHWCAGSKLAIDGGGS